MTADLREQLRGLATFLPRLEEPGCSFGQWVSPAKTKPRVFTMPYYSFSQMAQEFVGYVYEAGWIEHDFDWGSWKATPEAVRLRDDPAALAEATPEQLRRLLTVVVRQERFCGGSLQAAFRSGLLAGICRRAAQLATGGTSE